MGLTGIILKVAFFLRPVKTSWIKEKTLVAKNISQTFEIFENNLNSTTQSLGLIVIQEAKVWSSFDKVWRTCRNRGT